MFNTLFRIIRNVNRPTGFQAYLNNIQSNAHGEAPTVEEARQDYRQWSDRAMTHLR